MTMSTLPCEAPLQMCNFAISCILFLFVELFVGVPGGGTIGSNLYGDARVF